LMLLVLLVVIQASPFHKLTILLALQLKIKLIPLIIN
jgi:hypothetical protein